MRRPLVFPYCQAISQSVVHFHAHMKYLLRDPIPNKLLSSQRLYFLLLLGWLGTSPSVITTNHVPSLGMLWKHWLRIAAPPRRRSRCAAAREEQACRGGIHFSGCRKDRTSHKIPSIMTCSWVARSQETGMEIGSAPSIRYFILTLLTSN